MTDTPTLSTEPAVVKLVIRFLGAAMLAGVVGYVVLIRLGTTAEVAAPVMGVATTALGFIGGMLANTRTIQAPPAVVVDPPNPQPQIETAPVVAPPSPGDQLLAGLLHPEAPGPQPGGLFAHALEDPPPPVDDGGV